MQGCATTPITNGHPATKYVSEARIAGPPPTLTRVLVVITLTVPPWGHMITAELFSRCAKLEHLQRAVVDVHFAIGDGDRVGAPRERDSRGIQRYRVLIGVGNGYGPGIVVEQDLVRRDGHDSLDGRRCVAGQLAAAPVTAHPDRIGNVASLEFDPHARAGFGQECDAHVLSRVRHARHTPSGLLIAENRRHLRLDPQRGGIDAGAGTAILSVEAIPDPLEHFHHDLFVEAAHQSPPGRPPPDGCGPTALRTRTKLILCALRSIVCRTLHTKYLPEFKLPAPLIWTTVPTRSTAFRRETSASPWQRTNQPASRSSDCARRFNSPPSSTGVVSITVLALPANVARSRSASGSRPEAVASTLTPS